ncbi:MAG: allophanate hydrolase, partial [Pseudomonadota bacterium]
MTSLKVIDPGLATSLQDRGRRGYQRFGVPPSGALDTDSLAEANALVGAEPDAPALEMRFLGPTL